MSEFVLSLMRMTDEELIEYLIGESESRAVEAGRDEVDWNTVDTITDKIEHIKAELLRRM